MKKIIFEPELKYIIDRCEFEYNNRSRNLAFMIDRDLHDVDFLNSTVYTELEDKCMTAFNNIWLVKMEILDKYGLPANTKFLISRNHTSMTYDDTFCNTKCCGGNCKC